MPRTAIAVQAVQKNKAGQLTSVTPDAVNQMNFVNDGETELVVHNGDGSAKTVTIVSVPCEHGRTGDIVQNVAAGERAILGPFDKLLFNQADGTVNVDFSASTNVKVSARKRN